MALSYVTKGTIVAVLGVIVVIVGAILGWYAFPTIVNDMVAENMQLTNGSETWDKFVKLPFPLYFKVYLFEVANPEAVQNGTEKPKLVERGPYVYDQFREKVWMVQNNNYTVTYKQNQTFIFNEELSNGNDTDTVVILHPAMVAGVQLAIETLGLGEGAANLSINYMFNSSKDLFINDTVHNILFGGIKLNCHGLQAGFACRAIKDHLPQMIISDSDGDYSFALFRHKNATDDGVYTVHTGVDDASLIGKIAGWNYNKYVDTWSDQDCNIIKGSDSTVYSPHLTTEDKIDIFITDVCRSLHIVYEKEIEYKGIPGYRYIIDQDLFVSPKERAKNYCFCPKMQACFKNGIWDLTSCQNTAIFLSQPHFYMADGQYQTSVENLSPDKEKHQIFADIEPYTGIPLQGSKRVQFNLFLKRYPGVKYFSDVQDTLVPLVWIDEGVSLSDELVEMLEDMLLTNLQILEGVKWALVALGILLVLVGASLIVCGRRRGPSMKVNKE